MLTADENTGVVDRVVQRLGGSPGRSNPVDIELDELTSEPGKYNGGELAFSNESGVEVSVTPWQGR